MMTLDVMSLVYVRIIDVDTIPIETFECYPALMCDDKIDLLRKYAFTYVSLGVQTFSPSVLLANNRPVNNTEKLKRLVCRIRENSMISNCDLITFIDTKTCEDLRQLDADLDTLA